MKSYKPGDVVVLKSNPSTRMTVEGVDTFSVKCTWFDNDGNLKRDTFNVGAIMTEGGEQIGENLLLG